MALRVAATACFSREHALLGEGLAPVAGVDEAGRGPLAGPVVAAAVVLDPGAIPAGIADSKTVPEPRRERLYDAIVAGAQVGVGIVGVEAIDRDNILVATLAAMAEAVAALPRAAAVVLVDGNRAPALACRCETVVGGDGSCLSIAAASIVAKVTRDRLMRELDREFPGYGFAVHKGYPTAAHLAALTRLGPTPHHRHSFAPVAAAARAVLHRHPPPCPSSP